MCKFSTLKRQTWRRKWQATPVFLLGKSHRGAWWDRVTKGVRLDWLDWRNNTERQTGSRWGLRAMYAGTPGSQGAPPSWICTDLLQPEGWGALEGHWRGSAAELRSIPGITPVRGSTGGDPGSPPPPMPSQDQVLVSHCCSEPLKRWEKKAKHSWENLKKIQINGELYYVHGPECCCC